MMTCKSNIVVLLAGLLLFVSSSCYPDKSAWQNWGNRHDVCDNADWYFSHKQFDKALHYYKLAVANPWRSGIHSKDVARSQHAKYRIDLIEESINDHRGQPLKMYAEAVSKRPEEEERLLEQIKELYPYSNIIDDVDFVLVRNRQYTRGLEKSVENWKKFLSDHPESPLYKEAEKRLTITYNNLAVNSHKAGRDDEAEKWYELFIQQPVMTGEDIYLSAAQFLEQRGKLDLAEQAYQMDVYGGGWPKAYINLALFYEKHYNLEKYIEWLEKEGKEVNRRLQELKEYKRDVELNLFYQSYDLYTLHIVKNLMIAGRKIELKLYNKKEVFGEITSSIVMVSSADKQIPLKIDRYIPLDEIRYCIPRTAAPVLCIWNPNGGNCWNCSKWYVVSLDLYEDYFLENLGQVSMVEDFDKDGKDDLIVYEDIWEGLSWFCHADAPVSIIYYHIDDGKLVPDNDRNKRIWNEEIKELDVRIDSLTRKISRDAEAQIRNPGCELLQAMLEKFLRYRLLGEIKMGWQEMQKDLRYCDDRYFFFTYPDQGQVKIGKFPIKEVETTIKISLAGLSTEKGIRFLSTAKSTFRMVTHYGIEPDDIETTISALSQTMHSPQ